jgi:hypothetical protein
MKIVIAAMDESGLECPGCGSPDWSRAKGLDAIEGRILHAFYTCERPSCDGRFRVAFHKGRRVEVVLMWSDCPGAIERARAQALEPACVQASAWPATPSFKAGITLF